MHTNVILTNKRCTHAQSNYTNTKLKAWFRRLLCHPVGKRSGSILHPRTHTENACDRILVHLGCQLGHLSFEGRRVEIIRHVINVHY